MDNRSEVRAFLSTRRDRIGPAEAGLPAYGGNRRVPGLRREEVALHAVARALQLDDAETAHLFDLARTASASPGTTTPRRRADTVRPSILRILDAITDAPALIRNNYFDYVAANRLGRALYSPLFAEPAPNSARFAFLNPAAADFYVDWERNTQDLVATLRGEAGRDPYDKRLTDLIGELSTRSDRFRRLWAAHNVRYHRSGVKRLRHPVVGEIELTSESFELPADAGLTMSTYTAEPGSPSADALRVLASWTTEDASAASAFVNRPLPD